MLAMNADMELLVGFKPGDRIGNLCREVNTFLAPMMDKNFGSDLCLRIDGMFADFLCLRPFLTV